MPDRSIWTGQRSVWIGFDPREAAAFAVARISARKSGLPVVGLVLQQLRDAGLYHRPTERRDGTLYDVISEHSMATEFAISRFLVPYLAGSGWALFMDCDMMIRGDLLELFTEVERDFADKAVVCVKHDHRPTETTKMDGQVQSVYSKKNWSSFCLFNVDHIANRALTVEYVNSVPGRDLHAFSWLGDDSLIGALPVEWNWLVGHSDPSVEPKNVHWTDGVPTMPGYENAAYADDFRRVMNSWARNGA
jgi:hypothetical protein